MNIQGVINQLRRDIGALTGIANAGVTTQSMYLVYIDQVTDPKLPSLTFTVNGSPSLRQGNALKLNIYIGVYGKDQTTTSAMVTALVNYFTDGFYTATGSDFTIYSADLADTMFDYTPDFIEKLKAYESMVELTVLCG